MNPTWDNDPETLPGDGVNNEWQIMRNMHLPKNSAFTPVSNTVSVVGNQVNVIGHKWTGVTLSTNGSPAAPAGSNPRPQFSDDGTGTMSHTAMDVISGCALAPFYACSTMVIPTIQSTDTAYQRCSAFLVGDLPRIDFREQMEGAYQQPSFYTVTTQDPKFPGAKWYTDATSSVAADSSSQQNWHGFNRYSFFLNNPAGNRFQELWKAPFINSSVSTQNHNGPYSFPQFGTGPGLVQFRCVSAELRVKYTGTEEDRGGLVTSLEHPEHASVVGYTLAQMQAFDVCRTEAVMANKWHSCLFSGPINDTETEFSAVPLITPFMAIVVSGGTNLSFQVEGWANYEFTGDIVRNKISVCADEQGGVAVSTACKVLQSKKRFGSGQTKAVMAEAQRQISAGSGVSNFFFAFFLLTHM